MITEHFEIVEPTIRDMAWQGKGKIKYLVNGLQSWNDKAGFEIEVKRHSHSDKPAEWTFRIENIGYSVSSGNMPEAMKSYGLALADAGAKVELLAAKSADMEAIFQEGEATREAERKAEADRIQGLRDAEKSVGKKTARKMIEHMKREVKKLGRYDTYKIKVFERGTHKQRDFKVEFSYAGLALFSERYHRVSKNYVIETLADSNLQMLDVSECPVLPDPRLANFILNK